MRALSVRQPWAELILRGRKRIEVRSRPTNVRGRVYIYASLHRAGPAHERHAANAHRFDIDGLLRGVIIGTVEIVGSRPLQSSDLVKD